MTRKTLAVAAGSLVAGLFSLNASAGWDGMYLGTNFSWVDAEERWTSDENDDPVKAKDDGLGVGFVWGYNQQKGNFVVGFEADISATSAGPDVADWGSADRVSTEIDSVAHLRARTGYVVAEKFLPYVSLGVALARTETSIDNEQFDSVRSGLSYGLGVEWAARDNLRARLEWVRDEYGSEGYGSYDVLADSAFGRLETDSFSLGVLYAF